jgi:hypothetical protein
MLLKAGAIISNFVPILWGKFQLSQGLSGSSSCPMGSPSTSSLSSQCYISSSKAIGTCFTLCVKPLDEGITEMWGTLLATPLGGALILIIPSSLGFTLH